MAAATAGIDVVRREEKLTNQQPAVVHGLGHTVVSLSRNAGKPKSGQPENASHAAAQYWQLGNAQTSLYRSVILGLARS